DNLIEWNAERGCLVFEARHTQAVSVQGITPKAARADSGRMLVIQLALGPGETKEIQYANAVEGDRQTAVVAYDDLQANFSQIAVEHERAFNGLIRSAFTPGNSDFSGYLPQLETKDESLWQL